MATARAKPGAPSGAAPAVEQRMVIHGVSWKDYVILREDEILAVINRNGNQ